VPHARPLPDAAVGPGSMAVGVPTPEEERALRSRGPGALHGGGGLLVLAGWVGVERVVIAAEDAGEAEAGGGDGLGGVDQRRVGKA